ncbi:hypothetical protein RUND412_006625 [Rhizina undulata]
MTSYIITRFLAYLSPQQSAPPPPQPLEQCRDLSLISAGHDQVSYGRYRNFRHDLEISPFKFMIVQCHCTPFCMPYNRRLSNVFPGVIIIVRNVHEIQEIVRITIRHGAKLCVRNGGHSYAAHGLGGDSGAVMMDLVNLNEVEFEEGDGSVRLGGGVRLGDAADLLWEKSGGKAIPHGSCPAVGFAGHSLLGGFGHASRMWGLALDSIVEMSCVLADGSLVTASKTENEDLYWALRGAGPSFGIVVGFTCLTHDAPDDNVVYSYEYHYLDPKVATKAYMEVHEFGKFEALDNRLSLGVTILPGGSFSVRGVFFGPIIEFRLLMDPLFEKLDDLFGKGGIKNKKVNEMGWIQQLKEMGGRKTLRVFPEIWNAGVYYEHDCFYAKSLVEPDDNVISMEAVKALFNYLAMEENRATEGNKCPFSWFIICNLYGGPAGFSRIADPQPIPASSSCYAHRNSLFVWQFYASCEETEEATQGVVPFVDGMAQSIVKKMGLAKGWGAYPGYIDSELKGIDAMVAYYGDNSSRLLKLKEKYDPENLFSGGGLGLEV